MFLYLPLLLVGLLAPTGEAIANRNSRGGPACPNTDRLNIPGSARCSQVARDLQRLLPQIDSAQRQVAQAVQLRPSIEARAQDNCSHHFNRVSQNLGHAARSTDQSRQTLSRLRIHLMTQIAQLREAENSLRSRPSQSGTPQGIEQALEEHRKVGADLGQTLRMIQQSESAATQASPGLRNFASRINSTRDRSCESLTTTIAELNRSLEPSRAELQSELRDASNIGPVAGLTGEPRPFESANATNPEALVSAGGTISEKLYNQGPLDGCLSGSDSLNSLVENSAPGCAPVTLVPERLGETGQLKDDPGLASRSAEEPSPTVSPGPTDRAPAAVAVPAPAAHGNPMGATPIIGAGGVPAGLAGPDGRGLSEDRLYEVISDRITERVRLTPGCDCAVAEETRRQMARQMLVDAQAAHPGSSYDQQVEFIARRMARIEMESGWNYRAVGGVGEIGFTQIRPGTAQAILRMPEAQSIVYPQGMSAATPVATLLRDPFVNYQLGLAYERSMERTWSTNNPYLVGAMYNAGEYAFPRTRDGAAAYNPSQMEAAQYLAMGNPQVRGASGAANFRYVAEQVQYTHTWLSRLDPDSLARLLPQRPAEAYLQNVGYRRDRTVFAPQRLTGFTVGNGVGSGA